MTTKYTVDCGDVSEAEWLAFTSARGEAPSLDDLARELRRAIESELKARKESELAAVAAQRSESVLADARRRIQTAREALMRHAVEVIDLPTPSPTHVEQ